MCSMLTINDIIYIHDRVILSYGGATGLRDSTLLQSAVGRIDTGYYNHILETGAALFESIFFNHPFVDGNKRTAFCSFHVFLQLNGHDLRIHPDRLYLKINAWSKEHGLFKDANDFFANFLV